MTDNEYLFIILAFLAEILGTISGFGSSILFVPVATLFFDFKAVLAITAVFHIFSNLSKIALFRQGIDKNIAIKLGIPAIIFVIIGATLTNYLPIRQIELAMHIILVILAIYLMVNFSKTIAQTDRNLYIGGMASGFLAGMVGTGGAIRGLTLASFHLSKDIFIATSALIDLGVDTSRAIVYISNGYFLMQHIILIPFLIGISIAGSYIGKEILKKTSEDLFRYIVLMVVILSAVIQVLKDFGMIQL